MLLVGVAICTVLRARMWMVIMHVVMSVQLQNEMLIYIYSDVEVTRNYGV